MIAQAARRAWADVVSLVCDEAQRSFIVGRSLIDSVLEFTA